MKKIIIFSNIIMYYSQIRINTDLSFNANFEDYITSFRNFLKTKRTILGVIGGKHEEHCSRPHVHVNFLLDRPNPWKNKSCTMRYNFKNYLAKENLNIDAIENKAMTLKYEKIKDYENMSEKESQNTVMGYPLKERKPLGTIIEGYDEGQLENMTSVAYAYWCQIRKAKDHKVAKEEKKLNEEELMFKYLDANLVLHKNYIPTIDALNCSDDAIENEALNICSKPTKSDSMQPKVLLKNVSKKIIAFYRDYDLKKMPTKNSLLRKAIYYMFSKNYIDEDDYYDILHS